MDEKGRGSKMGVANDAIAGVVESPANEAWDDVNPVVDSAIADIKSAVEYLNDIFLKQQAELLEEKLRHAATREDVVEFQRELRSTLEIAQSRRDAFATAIMRIPKFLRGWLIKCEIEELAEQYAGNGKDVV